MEKIFLISGVLLFLSGCVEYDNLNKNRRIAPLVVASAEGDIDTFTN